MNTLGWVFILIAVLLMRAVTKGRVMEIGDDVSDSFLAIVRGDYDGLNEVLRRTGDSNIADFSDGTQMGRLAGVKTAHGFEAAGTSIAKASIKLGAAARGYRWEGTGPEWYDCSGLIWRACKAVGYKGSRFTTATLLSRTGDFKRISPPATSGPGVNAAGYDDIVLWLPGMGGLTGHMGVITGADKFYSARSPSSGISEAKISTFRRVKPYYVRYVGPRKETDPFG